MNTALIIYLFMATLSFGISIADHGKDRKPENAWATLIGFILSVSLVLLAVNHS